MKRILFLLLSIMAIASLQAQSIVTLGYCGGEATDKGSLSTEGKKWVSAAIYLPADMLGSYEGCRITKLRAALASKINVDSLRLWVRTSLDGPNLAEATITTKTNPKMVKGWNEATLESPYTIAGGEGLYIGMSYRQKTAVAALSIVGSPLANACWVQMGDDEAWQDMSSAGILSVEAIAEGENLPDYDLGLIAAIANPHIDASSTRMKVTVVNNGQQPVSGFTLLTQYEMSDDQYFNHFDVQLGWGEKAEVEYQIPSLSTVSYGDIIVSLQSIDDGTDQTAGNNSIHAKFALVKKVLIEEFTTEPCGNCPRVAGYLSSVLHMDQYKDRAVAVCHHSGYKTDWLTKSCDEKLAAFFGVGYAPAMMFDRQPLWGGDLHGCPELNDIKNGIDICAENPAHVSINISANYDEETRKLNVTVSGKRDELPAQNPCITVYLLENDVPAVNQTSGGSNFKHQHVIRAYNSDFGEPLIWDGNQYEYQVTFDVSDLWVTANMQIAAFVANHDSGNKKNCTVDNAEITGFPQGQVDGVRALSSADAVRTEYFTFDGQRANADKRGMVIVRQTNRDGYVRTYKTVRR